MKRKKGNDNAQFQLRKKGGSWSSMNAAAVNCHGTVCRNSLRRGP